MPFFSSDSRARLTRAGRRPLPLPLRLAALCVLTVLAMPSDARAAFGCAKPLNPDGPKSSDCLFILQAAVDIRNCALCVCDVNDSGTIVSSDALLCLRVAVGEELELNCPECSTTTTSTTTTNTFGEIDSCPAFAEWTTRAALGDLCTTNAQCDAGTCDTDAGRCRTSSDIDLGWTGTAHDIDPGDGATLRLEIDCTLSNGSCGVCEIDGVDATGGNCRCANDLRTTCDTPFQASANDCPSCTGGAFPGRACTTSGQCVGGPCERHCSLDPEIVCSANADCPTGRKFCDDQRRCGSGDGISCNIDADCIGSCSGAATCECYDSPPIPVTSEFPFCIIPRLASDVTGTIAVDTGAAEIVKPLELVAYTGLSVRSPCPTCGGTCNANHTTKCSADEDCAPGDTCELDPIANDGVRGGFCIGGANDGDACDLQATNSSFPARTGEAGGGGYSLDCMPEADTSFTGEGLEILAIEATDTSSLEAEVPCNPATPSAGNCPCLVCSGGSTTPCHTDSDCAAERSCSGWPQLPCNSNNDCSDINVGTCTTFNDTRCSENFTKTCSNNAECASADFGTCDPATCSSAGDGIFPSPNACSSEACTTNESGEGECQFGPDDRYCDGLRKADGSGIARCEINADCTALVIGFNAGTCTLLDRRDCFGDPIVGAGDVDSLEPVTSTLFCIAPTDGQGRNTSIGLPGPGRIVRQATVEYFCETDPEEEYTPGLGGCP